VQFQSELHPTLAEFRQAEGGEGSEDGEAGGHGEDEGDQLAAGGGLGHEDADGWVDGAEEDHVGTGGGEIAPAEGECVQQVARGERADGRGASAASASSRGVGARWDRRS
jgi:hypothetical protein